MVHAHMVIECMDKNNVDFNEIRIIWGLFINCVFKKLDFFRPISQ